MLFYEFKYSIDPKNIEYVQAITSYNKLVGIEKINNQIPDKEYVCRDLPEVIKNIKPAEKVLIDCKSTDNTATCDIFPPFEMLEEKIELKEKELLKGLGILAANLVKYIKHILVIQKSGYDVWLVPPMLPSLTRMQALWLLKNVNTTLSLNPFVKINIAGAVDLPFINKIVFQCSGINFILSYGKQANIKMTNISFNLDEGFISKSNISGVLKELNIAFNFWKERHYKGPLFFTSIITVNTYLDIHQHPERLIYSHDVEKNIPNKLLIFKPSRIQQKLDELKEEKDCWTPCVLL